jgi:hypothetical protein
LHRRIGGAHLGENFLGRNTAIRQPDASSLAILAFDAIEKVTQRRVVGGVAGQHLIGQRQPLWRHRQRDHHLHAVRPMIARVSVAALVAFRKRRIGLEIGAGQIVKQHIEAGVEQVPPALDQVIEQRLLVRPQPVVTGIELVDLRKSQVRAQQIRQRAAGEPIAVPGSLPPLQEDRAITPTSAHPPSPAPSSPAPSNVIDGDTPRTS